jgi:hypothetical protein
MRSLFAALLFITLAYSCTDEEAADTVSENDVDAARNFINAVLQADFDKAGNYILPDSVNKEYLALTEQSFDHRLTPEDKKGYKESSINIHGLRQVNDSVTVVQYSNSYKNVRDSLKVVKLDGKWLIDQKYSFPSNTSVK